MLDSEIIIFSFKFWLQWNYQCVLLRETVGNLSGFNSSNLALGYTKWNIEDVCTFDWLEVSEEATAVFS